MTRPARSTGSSWRRSISPPCRVCRIRTGLDKRGLLTRYLDQHQAAFLRELLMEPLPAAELEARVAGAPELAGDSFWSRIGERLAAHYGRGSATP